MILPLLAATALVLGLLWPLVLHERLTTFGVIGRTVESLNNDKCERIPLDTCEHLWMHEPTGYLYAACSSWKGRNDWLPCQDHLDAENAPKDDFLAMIDTRGSGPWSSRITKLMIIPNPKTLEHVQINVHGFDMRINDPPAGVDDTSDLPVTARVFVINHRPSKSPDGQVLDGHTHGANSTVEIFDIDIGQDYMTHVRTVAHPVIRTPNSIAAAGPDSFVFTNDHHVKTGHTRVLDMLQKRSDVGYCSAKGCKVALAPLTFPNGIIQGSSPREFWIGSSIDGIARQTELQADGSLVLGDEVKVGYGVDNLTRDSEGNIWAAAFPKALEIVSQINHPESRRASTAALRLSKNTGQGAFYGDKYKVDKILEDDGSRLSGKTVYVHDPKTKRLFTAGVAANMHVCQL